MAFDRALVRRLALSVQQTRRCVSSLESKGLLRRLARSGRSNEFEFLWHRVYEQAGERAQSLVTGVPQSPTIAPPQSSAIGEGQSHMSAREQSSVIGPGRSSVIARRESIQSSSSEEIQREENQQEAIENSNVSMESGDDERSQKRKISMIPNKNFFFDSKSVTAVQSITTQFFNA